MRVVAVTSSYFFFGERSSYQTVLSCLVIVIGYIEGIEGELHFSLIGTLYGFAASIAGSFYTVLVQRYLRNSLNSHLELCYYNNLNSCLIIPIVGLFNGELPIIMRSSHEITVSYFFWSSLGTFALVW